MAGPKDFAIPTANSASNLAIRDVIGSKSDTAAGNSLIAQAEQISALVVSRINTQSAKISTGFVNTHTAIDVVSARLNTRAATLSASISANYVKTKYKQSRVYPTLAAAKTVTANATAWVISTNYRQVVPASTIANAFTINGLLLEAPSTTGVTELVLYKGPTASAAEIGRTRFYSQESAQTIIPINTSLQAGNGSVLVKAATGTATADVISFSVFYHTFE